MYSLLSSIEPRNVIEASKDESWVKAMNEELDEPDMGTCTKTCKQEHNWNQVGLSEQVK